MHTPFRLTPAPRNASVYNCRTPESNAACVVYEGELGRRTVAQVSDRLNAWAKGIEGDRVVIFNLYTGAEEEIAGVDTVVLATGPRANDDLYFALKGEVENLHRIGDCVAPRKLDHAIYEGYLAGCELWSPDERYIYEGELERWEEVVVAV